MGWQGTWHYKNAQHAKLTPAFVKELEARNIDLNEMLLATFVRNPYSWVLSVWNNFYRVGESNSIKRFEALFPNKEFSDFTNFIAMVADGDGPPVWGSTTQSSFVPESIKSPDFIGKFETFEVDLRRLAETLNISINTIPHEVQHKSDDRSDYMSYYSAESARIIQKVFKEDFERFGYRV